ncbi:MAG TPA: carboxypeptidase regulatory-like domain-containing protein [Gemmatimonadaceae bacterium]|nr:carboxypeptidase regulatory-like domain-containing protein [Gemmatimonadaceae bacterium]
MKLRARHLPVVLALLTPAALRAQSQATTGIIRGTVTDSTGAPAVGATVTLRNVETNFARTLPIGDRGGFTATLLPLGTYEATARALGFAAATRRGIVLRLGQTVEVPFVLQRLAVGLSEVQITGATPTVDVTQSQAATRLDDDVVSGLPNNGRNYLNLTLLTPSVAITQGPDGDVLSVGGQRGIHNNVSVDGADFNNPFFGEQRGGQRPPFTFNLDAVQEVVVIAQGAPAEFGRSSGGFVNVITKSGTNQLRGSLHYYGKQDQLSAQPRYKELTFEPDFRQHQFGFTLGGPIRRDRAFFFLAYDQQVYDEVKQRARPGSTAFDSLLAFTDTAFGGRLRGDFGPIARTADAQVAMAKIDVRLGARHNASLKYNYTNSRQENGTFDVDVWGRSANGVEKDYSNAINGSLASQLSPTVSNEFRFQLAREDRPRPYSGPQNPITGRDFPDTGMDFVQGFRFGRPFFLPVSAYDTRIQVLDNVSWARGDHLFKVGAEWNRTEEKQTFIGFANGRMIFSSVTGFLNYNQFGNLYVECSNGTSSTTGACPAGTTITGPVQLYLQQAGVGGRTVEEAGTQRLPQHELALYVQDSWEATPRLTVNYGLRWEAQIQPDPITPGDEVFFRDFIGRTVTNATGTYRFPSNGEIPSDYGMFQPRLGIAWDVSGDGRQVVRASSGLYYARVPGLNLASTRSTNGSIGQTIFRNSALTGVLGPPPRYGELLPAPAGEPFRPDVFVFDEDFRNPRTWSSSVGYEREIADDLAASISYTHMRTDFLTRFINRNDPVFGDVANEGPWSRGLNGGPNGVGVLTVVESSARSRYNGATVGLKRSLDPNLQFQLNYTLSFDKSDDDNERDPFSFRYAQANRLDREYNWSDRDQRHRFNAWLLARVPGNIYLNNRVSAYSAQPASEACGTNDQGAGRRATGPGDRVCRVGGVPTAAPTGVIIQRNGLRKDNAFFSWDVRISRPFVVPGGGQLEAIVEVFNVTNHSNFRDPAATSLLFNFDGTIRSGLGDPRQVQAGVRYVF